MKEKKICDSLLNLVMALLDDDDDTRGCCGSGIIRNKENETSFTVEYNFSFKIIDNETGEEI